MDEKETPKTPKIKKPEDNASDQQNRNLGTSGTNQAFDSVNGNKGKQLNPNNKDK